MGFGTLCCFETHVGLQALWGSMVMTWAERWGWLGLELLHGPLCFMLWLEDRQHQTKKARRLRFFRKACAPMEFCLVATRLTSSQGPCVAGVQQALSLILYRHTFGVLLLSDQHASVCSFLLWTFSCLWKDMHQTLGKKHVPQNIFCPHPIKKFRRKKNLRNAKYRNHG